MSYFTQSSLRLSIFNTSIFMAVLGFAATLATVAPVTSVQAQDAGAMLEEIVVTARRREESLLDVPVAISVLNSDFIAESNILDHYDLYAETPGIEYTQSRDRLGSRPAIRGVSTTAQNILQQKMGAFIDGAPLLGNTGSLQFTDLERIEVLRGPQSSAFGRSTFSGAFSYITRDPGTEHTSTIKAATSNLSRNVFGISLDGPLTETLGYTLDLYTDEFEGPDNWVATDGSPTGSTKTDFIAGKLKWAPSERFDMEVRVSWMEPNDAPSNEIHLTQASRDACTNITLPNGQPYIDGTFDCELRTDNVPRNTDLTVDGGYTPGTQAYNIALANSVLDPTSQVTRERFQAEFNFPRENGSLLQVITSYNEEAGHRWHDQDQGNAPVSVNTMNNMVGMTTQNSGGQRYQDETYLDVRWVSPGDQSLRWLVGASYFDFIRRDNSYRQFAAILHPELDLANLVNGGAPFRPNRRQYAENTAIGLYGNVTYDLSDQTTVSFEGRFQEDERLTIEPISGRTVLQITESFQPRLAVNHALNDEWAVYGQLSRGTNPAHSNPVFADDVIIASLTAARAAGIVTYDETTFRSAVEEELTNFEVGIKGRTLDGRLQLAAAIYAMDWKDQILGAGFDWEGAPVDPVTGTCTDEGDMPIPDCWNDGSFDPNGVIYQDTDAQSGMVFINRGDGELKGVELEATWRATDRLNVRGTLTLMDNIYARNCDQEPVDDMGYTATATIAEDGVLFDCYDVSGNKIEQAAGQHYSLSATYRAPLGGGGWEWMGRLGVRHEGPQFIELANLTELPGVTTANGSVGFYNDNWQIILFGNNLTDEDAPRELRGLRNDREIGGRTPRNYNFLQRIPRELGVRADFSF